MKRERKRNPHSYSEQRERVRQTGNEERETKVENE